MFTAALCLFGVVMLPGDILFTFGSMDIHLGPDVVIQSSKKHTHPRATFPCSLPCGVLPFSFFFSPSFSCTRVEEGGVSD